MAFIWGDQGTTRKSHVVGWKTMMLPKHEEGMAICNLVEMNKAYLMKMGWTLCLKNYGLWGEVLIGKYGKRGSLNQMTLEAKGIDSHIGKSISKGLSWLS